MCPQAPIEHPTLSDLLAPIRALYEDVRKKALIRCEYDGLRLSETTGGDDQLAAMAMDRYAYYVCCKCGKVRTDPAPTRGSRPGVTPDSTVLPVRNLTKCIMTSSIGV